MSVRDALTAAVAADAASSGSSSPAPSSSPESSSPDTSSLGSPATPVNAATPESVGAKSPEGVSANGVNRASDGKFAPKAPDTSKPEGSVLAPQDAPKDPAAKTPTAKTEGTPETGTPMPPPRGWQQEMKVEWTKLPPSIQQEIGRREQNRDNYLRQQVQKATDAQKRYSALDEVLAPRRQAFAAKGMNEAQVIGQLLALSDAASNDKPGFIRWFAKENGIDLATLTAANPDAAPVDPTLKAMQDELGRVKTALTTLHSTREAETRAQAEQRVTGAIPLISRWAAETDAQGQPKRPYFEAVADEIPDFIQRLKAKNPGRSESEYLQTAYDMAVWANPDTRAAEQSRESQKRQIEEQRKSAEAAEIAKRTGASLAGSPSASPSQGPTGSVRGALEKAWASHGAAA